ncbi:MAG: FG-GAP-like repeat-containing protein [Hormoscilla sp.]
MLQTELLLRSRLSVGDRPYSVVVGNFNGDGILDLAVANLLSDNVSVLLGQGTETGNVRVNFNPAIDVAVGDGPRYIAAGDFNGDAFTDLAVANFFSDNVSVLLGNGTGNLGGNLTNIDVGDGPGAIAVTDINGDGFQDLAVANKLSSSITLLLGNGRGNFNNSTTEEIEGAPVDIATGDFNGDGFEDLVVAEYSDNVSVLLGDGQGDFNIIPDLEVGNLPSDVEVGDFDEDGALDLVVANSGSNNVSVLLGDGIGNFSDATNFLTGNRVQSVVVADLNRDSDLDLLVANSGSNNLSVLEGDGTGTFGVRRNFAVGGSFPIDIALGSINDDSFLDVVVANSGINNVSVLLNATEIDFDTPPSVEFAAANYRVNEDGTVVGAEIVIDRSGNFTAESTIQVQLVGDTAIGGTSDEFDSEEAGIDFDESPITVLFAANQITATVNVPINDDRSVEEEEETLTLELINPNAGTNVGEQNTTILTIVDNDPPFVEFAETEYQVSEDGTLLSAAIVINREGGLSGSSVVQVQLIDGTAIGGTEDQFNSGVDFDNSFIPVVFLPDQTTAEVTVPINDDERIEDSETLRLELFDTSSDIVIGEQNTATLVIVDNEPPPIEAQQVQAESSEVRVLPNNIVNFDVTYSTLPDNIPSRGLGLRMHWDSTQISFTGLTNILDSGTAQPTGTPQLDVNDLDSDPNTDSFIVKAWSDISKNWPEAFFPLPVDLFTANFVTNLNFDSTRVNFTATSVAEGADFMPTSVQLLPTASNLDIDGNGQTDALTDGILALGYLLGFRGDDLIGDDVGGAVGVGATRSTAEAITNYLDLERNGILDVDGNGVADALTDGSLILRYLFGLSGDPLISGVVAPDATRFTPEAIEDHLGPLVLPGSTPLSLL